MALCVCGGGGGGGMCKEVPYICVRACVVNVQEGLIHLMCRVECRVVCRDVQGRVDKEIPEEMLGREV